MTRLPTLFFVTAAMFALAGMIWGIQMSASHDHSLSPAHGHLNLLGFVAMSVFGTYYALTPRAAAQRLAAIHYAASVATVLILTPGIALAILDRGAALAQAGSVLAVLTMALFAFVVIRHGVGDASGQHAARDAIAAQPAE